MKKILLNGVDGNFGSRSARVLLEKYPHEALRLQQKMVLKNTRQWALKPELPILTMRKN